MVLEDFSGLSTATILSLAVFCLIGYLLGSISFAVIFTKKFANTDVRDHGSGNAGMTNVVRTAGKLPGILTFIFDFLKGTIAMFLVKYLCGPVADIIYNAIRETGLDMPFPSEAGIVNPAVAMAYVGIFALLGHMFPIFFKFRGGKGVATIAGILIVLSPFAMLISLATFLALTLITKIVSSSSIVGVTLATVLTYAFYCDSASYVWFSGNQRIVLTVLVGVMALMVILKHHENIVRLIHGNENKLGEKAK